MQRQDKNTIYDLENRWFFLLNHWNWYGCDVQHVGDFFNWDFKEIDLNISWCFRDVGKTNSRTPGKNCFLILWRVSSGVFVFLNGKRCETQAEIWIYSNIENILLICCPILSIRDLQNFLFLSFCDLKADLHLAFLISIISILFGHWYQPFSPKKLWKVHFKSKKSYKPQSVLSIPPSTGFSTIFPHQKLRINEFNHIK